MPQCTAIGPLNPHPIVDPGTRIDVDGGPARTAAPEKAMCLGCINHNAGAIHYRRFANLLKSSYDSAQFNLPGNREV